MIKWSTVFLITDVLRESNTTNWCFALLLLKVSIVPPLYNVAVSCWITASVSKKHCKQLSKCQSKSGSSVTASFCSPTRLCYAMISFQRWGSLVRRVWGDRNVSRVRGCCLSLAIVWTQFLSCWIDHRQGVAEGGHILGEKGEGILALMDTGERLERTAYFLLVRTGRRVVSGERRRMRKSCCSGWDFVPL